MQNVVKTSNGVKIFIGEYSFEMSVIQQAVLLKKITKKVNENISLDEVKLNGRRAIFPNEFHGKVYRMVNDEVRAVFIEKCKVNENDVLSRSSEFDPEIHLVSNEFVFQSLQHVLIAEESAK